MILALIKSVNKSLSSIFTLLCGIFFIWGCRDLPQVEGKVTREAPGHIRQATNTLLVNGKWTLQINFPAELVEKKNLSLIFVTIQELQGTLTGKVEIPSYSGEPFAEGSIKGVLEGQRISFMVNFSDDTLGPFYGQFDANNKNLVTGEVVLQAKKTPMPWRLVRDF